MPCACLQFLLSSQAPSIIESFVLEWVCDNSFGGTEFPGTRAIDGHLRTIPWRKSGDSHIHCHRISPTGRMRVMSFLGSVCFTYHLVSLFLLCFCVFHIALLFSRKSGHPERILLKKPRITAGFTLLKKNQKSQFKYFVRREICDEARFLNTCANSY